MPAKPKNEPTSPETAIRAFLERFDAKEQKLFRAVRTRIKKRFPTANELAYDYDKSVVISFTPNLHGKDGVAALSLSDDGVRLYLMNGPRLADPKKLLAGTGKATRFLTIDSAGRIDDPDVCALIDAAAASAKTPMPATKKGAVVIQSSAATRKPRKKPAK